MRKIGLAIMIALGAFVAAPAQAGGFLQDIFNGLDRQRAPIVYRYAPAQPQVRFVYDEGLRVSRRPQTAKKTVRHKFAIMRLAPKKKILARAAPRRPVVIARVQSKRPVAYKAPSLQQTALCCKNGEDPSTQIGQDKTLRVGDAYMTPQGLRIYRGRGASAKESAAFVDYRKAGIGVEMRARLAAMDEQRGAAPSDRGPRASHIGPRLITVAHIASGGANSKTSHDRQGKVIRHVGP